MDAAIYSISAITNRALQEVAPYATTVGLNNNVAVDVMNLEFYNKLPSDVKEQFDQQFSPKLAELTTTVSQNDGERTLQELRTLFQSKEGEIIELSREELAKFVEAAKPSWQQWVDAANKLGYDGKALMNDFIQIMKEEGIEPPFDLSFIR